VRRVRSRGQGSSAQATAVTAWIKNYRVACSAATIEYAAVRSGAGATAFVGAKGNFAGSDSALTAAVRSQASGRCGGAASRLPIAVGPIALAYNVAGVDDLRLKPVCWANPFISTDHNGVCASWAARACGGSPV
jgi:phosphate transport system substrate-binding protein